MMMLKRLFLDKDRDKTEPNAIGPVFVLWLSASSRGESSFCATSHDAVFDGFPGHAGK